MDKEVERYLNSVCSGLGLSSQEENDLREELASHLEEAISGYMGEGKSEKEAVRKALQEFGKAEPIRRRLKGIYWEVYLMSTIGKIIYHRVFVGMGMSLATLLMAVSLGYGAWGVYKLFQLPPGPTSWHDANTEALTMVAFGLPLLVLFVGSLVNWYRTKEMPSKLVVWVMGLSIFLFMLADLATK